MTPADKLRDLAAKHRDGVAKAIGKWMEDGAKRPKRFAKSPRCTARPRHDGPELFDRSDRPQEGR